MWKNWNPETIVKKEKNKLSKYNSIVIESKTEVCVYSNVKPNVKTVRTLLDESAEFNKRKQLSGFALYE